jgi:hypothetical protein
MQALGLLTWQRRIVRAGWRTEQTSNAYMLIPTAALPAVCCGGQSGRATKRIDISYSKTVGIEDTAARESAIRQLRALGQSVPAGW